MSGQTIRLNGFYPTSPKSTPKSSKSTPKKSPSSKTPTKLATPKTPKTGDRFIPNRSAMDLERCHHILLNISNSGALDTSPSKEFYLNSLHRSLFNETGPSTKILKFNEKINQDVKSDSEPIKQKNIRNIQKMPERILDAPDLRNDYYLNLLDWSKENLLAVGLGQSLYIWNGNDSSVYQMMSLDEPENYITSVNWSPTGSHLALGTNYQETQLWDISRKRIVRSFRGHTGRVSSLAWNGHILSTGSRDSLIMNNDLRIPNSLISVLEGHTQEVCGLKWSVDGSKLASGGNDNLLNIWDPSRSEESLFRFDHHQAAVKALAWSPFQTNLLASGGGTADRHIRFWNTGNGMCINAIDTRSQVCSLLWLKQRQELVSSHGFSQNQLTLWRYPDMTKIADLTGHTSRVLHMAMSPDGTTVVSAAADESLRFWKIFDKDLVGVKRNLERDRSKRTNLSIR
eukprot:TRINITY_DN8032_c0_g1_i3.p1 TRINITY_DN8032_c0_g1~~TRINITY_DN8032_c0_g1_i3.p1  ORF type:complete len:473 (+),score=91.49 TRINITY_DN8032_c0_g1_i3:54-1421(+)